MSRAGHGARGRCRAQQAPFERKPATSYDPDVQEVTTEREIAVYDACERRSVPGLVLVWASGHPTCCTFDARTPLVLGRTGATPIDDRRMSRQHVEVEWPGTQWLVRDLGSSNGTFVDDQAVSTVSATSPRVLRAGGALFLFEPDILRFDAREDLREGGDVLGPWMLRAKAEAIEAARSEKSLLVTGETGTGKRRVAEWYHGLGPRGLGKLVVLNCATLPPVPPEMLLFGTEDGARSRGGTGTNGLFRDAHKGVLFLDAVTELPLDVQAKLLRAVESKEVLPYGSTRPQPADTCIVSATNVDMQEAVRAGRFKHHLCPRLAQREVRVPPLRERREEIPFVIADTLARLQDAPPPSVAFVEACLLRHWHRNVRELVAAVERAAAEGRRTHATELTPEMLPPPMACEEGDRAQERSGVRRN